MLVHGVALARIEPGTHQIVATVYNHYTNGRSVT